MTPLNAKGETNQNHSHSINQTEILDFFHCVIPLLLER